MKVLLWNECERYYYPESILTLDAFVEYADAHRHKLIPLYMLATDNCVHPFYIEEEKKLCYLNVSSVSSISEDDVEVLSRSEYENRLRQVINAFCIHCVSYEEDSNSDHLKNFMKGCASTGHAGPMKRSGD